MKRIKLARGLTIGLVGALFVGIAGAPAVAGWRVHNPVDATEMTAPPGGTEDQTCADRLRGSAGWMTFIEEVPPVFPPPPPEAFLPATYEIWRAPAGFTDFSQADPVFDGGGDIIGYNFFDPVTFDPVPATLLKTFTTAARTELPEPIAVNGGSPFGDNYVFTAAPFDEAMTGNVPGDTLGLKPIGDTSFRSLAVVDCAAEQTYTFAGFGGPVNGPPTVNVGEAGASYKVRFRLKDNSGQFVTSLSAVSDIRHASVPCARFAYLRTDVIELTVSGPSRLLFAAKPKQFVYRWRTPAAAGCYTLTFTFGSDLNKSVFFKLL